MKRMGGWLQAKPGRHASSRSMNALDEQHALQDALSSAVLIMNDEIERAEIELDKGTSPFHKSGAATACFLRAALGFEKEVMEQAGNKLAEAEEAAAEYQRRAVRNPSASHQSNIYPPGSEYALCHAEAQLMSAVIGVLNESLTESLRGFYKLRKAFATLSEITEAEKRFLKARGMGTGSQISSKSTLSTTQQKSYQANDIRTPADDSGVLTPNSSDEDDDLEFEDAKDQFSGQGTPALYQGHLEYPQILDSALHAAVSKNLESGALSESQHAGVEVASESAAKEADEEIDFRTITSDPIDLFIHAGTALCFGLLQLMLSMVPPAFARLLSIFSFRGNREAGLRMLWSATKFKDSVNGAMAGLITLGFHNGAIAFCDILSKDALPEARLRALLADMRESYPRSKLWLLEEARMLARDRKLETAVDIVANGPKSPLKQVEALGLFEMSLNFLYLHRYQDCAESFIKCVGLNNWSHALYYYIAGVCYVELYRIHKNSNPDQAKEYAAKAEKYLLEVPSHAGKRRFMARQLPFDVFVTRKISKWEARAKARECSFVDAIGVSPAVEMIYFWPGFRRMRPEHIEIGLERLSWSENIAGNANESSEPTDERAIHHLLRGVSLRNLGRTEEAISILNDRVISVDLYQLKACSHPDTWTLPVAHYELAVCYWQQAGGEDGERSLLTKCSDELAKLEKWETFDLEARIGMKVTTGRETLRKAGIGPS